MKTETIAETDYYELVLKILHPPRKPFEQLTLFDDDESSRLELRKRSAAGEDLGYVNGVSIKDSELYNRKHPVREKIDKKLGKQHNSLSRQELQKQDLLSSVARLSSEMNRLETNMQRKLKYYQSILPHLKKRVGTTWPKSDKDMLHQAYAEQDSVAIEEN